MISDRMASRPDKVRADALSLPTPERARLAHDLIASLDDSQDPGAAEAWVAQLERRAREVESGAAQVQDWAVVRARWANRWRKP
jgi:putative addiction module component (TIGR02574 family)